LKVVTKQSVIIFSRLSVTYLSMTYLCKYSLLVGTTSTVLRENWQINAEHWENDRLRGKPWTSEEFVSFPLPLCSPQMPSDCPGIEHETLGWETRI